MPHRPFMHFENPVHGLLLIGVLIVVLIVVVICEKIIEGVKFVDDRRELQKALRKQSCKIGANKSRAEMNAIIIDVQIAVKEYRKARRKAFWAKFWDDVNDPRQPRLFF